MLSGLDDTIKQLLVKKGKVDIEAIDISFDTPDREWAASLSRPTINIYLYDIRENCKLRGTEWIITRDENGNTTKTKNASRIDLSYLITVWTKDIMDEHRLLWYVLATLFNYKELPDDILSAQLQHAQYPIKATTAQPDGLFNNPADFWSALENKIKPSINYVVTLPLDPEIIFTAPMVRTKVLEFSQPDTAAEDTIQVIGRLRESGMPDHGVKQATIIAKEAGMTAITDSQGYYCFRKLAAGRYTLQIRVQDRKPIESAINVPGKNYDIEI